MLRSISTTSVHIGLPRRVEYKSMHKFRFLSSSLFEVVKTDLTFFCMSSALGGMEWTSAMPMRSRIRTVTRIDLVKPFSATLFAPIM